MSTSLTITEAASLTGLSAYTLRYYEQIGLIAPIERRSGVRRYSPEDIRWLEFLVRLRATGMPMRDMQRYAQLLRQGPIPQSLRERRTMLEQHAEQLEADIRMQTETLEYIRSKIHNLQDAQAPVVRKRK